jgi:hypothetical protein
MPHDSADLTGREAATHWGRGRPCIHNQQIPSAGAPTGNVSIITSGHPVEPSRRRAFTTAKSIVIERNVWIAAGATIIGGVTVGENSVVAAGSVVTRTFPPILLSEETRRGSFVRLPTEGATFLRLSKLPDFRPEIAVAAVLISAAKTKAARGPLRVRLRRTLSEQISSGVPQKADIARCRQHIANVPTADMIKEAANCGGLTFSMAVSGLCYGWLADCRDRYVLRMMVDRSKHRQLQFYCSERLIGSIRRECVDHITSLSWARCICVGS